MSEIQGAIPQPIEPTAKKEPSKPARVIDRVREQTPKDRDIAFTAVDILTESKDRTAFYRELADEIRESYRDIPQLAEARAKARETAAQNLSMIASYAGEQGKQNLKLDEWRDDMMTADVMDNPAHSYSAPDLLAKKRAEMIAAGTIK